MKIYLFNLNQRLIQVILNFSNWGIGPKFLKEAYECKNSFFFFDVYLWTLLDVKFFKFNKYLMFSFPL